MNCCQGVWETAVLIRVIKYDYIVMCNILECKLLTQLERLSYLNIIKKLIWKYL